ncbi:MORN repeat-containing protein [Tunturiibacter lichenicola]|uniref:hypothetical protein n=1 Tax=Tunturiibacter lichenicola TaxID=2051959 RepID=UPI0021B2E64B|nr:hypothetical protein [Edaphobacter lichenicola]
MPALNVARLTNFFILLILIAFLTIGSFGQIIQIDKRVPQYVSEETQTWEKMQQSNPDQDLTLIPRYWVIFAANPAFEKIELGTNRHTSWTGHIFVILATEDRNKQETRIDAFGFYPLDKSGAGALRSVLSSVPGSVEDNLTGVHAGSLTPDTRILSVEISGAQQQQAYASMFSKYPKMVDVDRDAQDGFEPTDDNPYGPTYTNFSIPGNDCVSFANTVASSIGLKTPSTGGSTATPNGFIKALEAMNVSGAPSSGDQHIYMRLNFAYSPDGQPSGTYEGTVDPSGSYDGHGIISAPSGAHYDMNFSHGTANGPAHVTYPDGSELTGVMSGGTLTNGVLIDPSGATHAVSLNPNGTLHFDDQNAGAGGGDSGADHGNGGDRGGDHEAGAGHAEGSHGPSTSGNHSLNSDHYTVGGRDMGPAHDNWAAH